MSAYFNGTTDTIDLTGSSALGALTPPLMSFFAWVRPTRSTAYGAIASVGGAGRWGFYVKSSGQLAVYIDAAAIDPGSVTLTANLWYHVGWTWSTAGATGFNLYVNGVLDTVTSNSSAKIASASDTFLGSDVSGIGGNSYGGSIADVAIYNTTLTVADAALLASGTSPLAVRGNNLIGYWPLDGYSGIPLDRGPSGFLGALTGTAIDSQPPGLMPYPQHVLASIWAEGEMPALFTAVTPPPVAQSTALGFIEVEW